MEKQGELRKIRFVSAGLLLAKSVVFPWYPEKNMLIRMLIYSKYFKFKCENIIE